MPEYAVNEMYTLVQKMNRPRIIAKLIDTLMKHTAPPMERNPGSAAVKVIVRERVDDFLPAKGNVIISGIDNPRFWDRHNRSADYKELRRLAHGLPSLTAKISHGIL